MIDSRIDEIQKFKDAGEPTILVNLAKRYSLHGAHSFTEGSMKSVRETLKNVKPCTCEDCK